MWIEAIERVGTDLVPVVIDARGSRQHASLRQLRSTLPSPSGAKSIALNQVSLGRLQLTDASAYLAALGLPRECRRAHEVYCLEQEGRCLHIPTAVLLSAFISRLAHVGDGLLRAGSLDQTVGALVRDDKVDLEYHWRGGLAAAGREPEVHKRFLWLTCFPSARRLWNSIYLHACEGRLGMTPPNARISGKAYTFRRADGACFVSRIAIHEIEPLEKPLPFAEGVAELAYRFDAKRSASAANIRSHLDQAEGKRQGDISPGPDGWALTDDEWREIVSHLKSLGRRCPSTARAHLDVSLHKHGTGTKWADISGRSSSNSGAYSRWLVDGRWDEVKTVLRRLRQCGK